MSVKRMRPKRNTGRRDIWQLRVMFPNEFKTVVATARGGDRRAQALLELINGFFQRTHQITPCCLLCERPIPIPDAMPAALAILVPVTSDPEEAVVSAVCSDCVDIESETLGPRVLRKFQSADLAGMRVRGIVTRH